MSFTQAELEERRGYLGSSEVAAALGKSKWTSPWKIWAEKTGRIEVESVDNKYTRRGQRLEPVLLEWFEEESGQLEDGHWVEPNRTKEGSQLTVQGPEPWMRATPDGYLWDVGDPAAARNKPIALVEAKTASWHQRGNWGEEGTDEIPEEYLVQVVWQMACVEVDRTYVAALVDGDFRWYLVYRDHELEARVLAAAGRFWRDYVLGDKEPEPDGSDSTREAIEAICPHYVEDMLVGDAHADRLASELRERTMARKDAERAEEAAKQALMGRIRDRSGWEGPGGKVYWKRPKPRAVTNYRAIVEELKPDEETLARHTRVTNPKRSFRAYLQEA